ncbi:tripartite tricarboxylate transporter TctB family protein [Rhodovarius crocodyli]|uniref:Tripartite tricarboxylate transporter TctB family protein n=1 Tax=Rhodovarius crocodyli TaxID=1979269 RepID=A0A437ME32_9PROT|nr:tripartite tricarboxylate transporter TctB family protein [Rhodovarius crocodyli]RVT95894.1 tripartite tricarboxylate transporter TctB family protein [Rhodovarius crocodyli]
MIADRLLGLGFVLVGAVAAWSAWNLVVPFAADPLGPTPFPVTVALILMVCGGLLVINPTHRFEPIERKFAPPLMVVAMLAYALLMEPLGFMPATALLALAIALLFGARILFAAAVAVITAVTLWVLFDKILDLPLPKGILPL